MSDAARSISSSGDRERSEESLERRLEEHFLGGGGSLSESLLRESGEDAEEVLRLLALNELAEHGLDLLEREGAGVAVEGIDAGRGLGDYRLIQEIGSGGMGVLYLAEDTVLGRLVALKLLTRSTATATERFRREAEITASLDHPAIVPVYARGEHDGVHYIAMRYIAGKDIERTLTQSKESGRSGASALYDQVVRWCATVADGLDYAHRAGVVHRDVKPSNVLVEDDTPYLVDFGLARHEDAVTLTQPGDLLGTVPYMSPEQIRAGEDELDGRTDVYSLGATLYQLLAGVVPFAGRSSQAIARQVLTRDPAPLRRYGIPRDLEAIVFRAMEKERDRRYATASELRDDLERYLAREPVRARHLGPLRRAARIAGRYRKTVASVVVALTLITFFAVRAWNAEQDRMAAARRTFEAAEVAGDRGLYSRACGILTELRADSPDYPGLDGRLAEFRRRELHDRLMQFMLSIPADERTLAGDVQTEQTMEGLLAEARSIEASDVLGDEFRFLEIVWLWHTGRLDEAHQRLGAWEVELGAPTRATFVLTHLIDAGFAARAGEDPAELPALDEHPARKPNERYFTALVLTLTKEDIGRGLREIDAYLANEPRDYWARNMRAIFLREHREYGQAREVYSAMIDSLAAHDSGVAEDGKVHFAYYKRGNVASLQRDYAAALADFERAAGTVAEWRIARAMAHCRRGLGDTTAAVELYEDSARRLVERKKAVEETAGLQESRRERSLLLVDRNLADVLGELALCRKEAGEWEEAEAAVTRLASLAGAGLRAAELRASILLERTAAEAPPFAGDRAPWTTLAAELDRLVESWPESKRIPLARREAWFWGAEDVDQQAFVERLAREGIADAEERLWRARISLHYVLKVKHTLGDARLREGATAAERRAWDEYFDRVDRFARRAADDLGYLERLGFGRLKSSLDTDYIEFLLGLARLWTNAPATASGIFSDLMHRPTVARHGWHPLVILHLGEALEAEGDELGALLSYKYCVRIDTEVGLRALSRAGRMVARRRDVDELEEIVELMEETAPDRAWLRAELRHVDYANVRDADCVADHLED